MNDVISDRNIRTKSTTRNPTAENIIICSKFGCAGINVAIVCINFPYFASPQPAIPNKSRRAPKGARGGRGFGRDYMGILPCFLGMRVWRFPIVALSACAMTPRVSAGSMTSVIIPFSAA